MKLKLIIHSRPENLALQSKDDNGRSVSTSDKPRPLGRGSRRLILIGLIAVIAFSQRAVAQGRSSEKIVYNVARLGKAEFNDWGRAKLGDKIVRFFTFRTQIIGFDDLEKIYVDEESFLPLRVERGISLLGNKEQIVEEYDAKNCSLLIKKFKGKKIIEQHRFKENSPIHNAVILPFYLRKIPELNIGWSMNVLLPNRFKVKLISIEQIQVPAGKFNAYHFISQPKKFEIWLSADKLRLPLKIVEVSGLGYALSMQEHE